MATRLLINRSSVLLLRRTQFSKGADPFSATSQFLSFTLPIARAIVTPYITPFSFTNQAHLLVKQPFTRWYSTEQSSYKQPFNWKWVPLPIAAIIAYFILRRYQIYRANEQDALTITKSEFEYQQILASDIEVGFLRMLPLRLVSRLWGFINDIPLPAPVRVAIIKYYSHTFNCRLDEVAVDDLKQFKNLGDFFRRELKPNCRPIEQNSAIVSPADGVVVHFGKIENDKVEQVKGVNYSLPAFLGPQTWTDNTDLNSETYYKHLKANPSNSLYQCVIYLAPGDYHRFHSPSDWVVDYRRHFSGKLFSIRPSFMAWIDELFTINERVAYVGNWMHGFFSMTAVGATNVGSIKVYFDEKLKTNKLGFKIGSYRDEQIAQVKTTKGAAFGEFNLGSTIVLIFEAPSDAEFDVAHGHHIKYGEKLFSLNRSNVKG